jgi:pilus assembly protein Flp/PilA
MVWAAKLAMKTAYSFRNDEQGVTAMEYALIAALVAVVLIGSLTTVGSNLSTKFVTIATSLT